MFKLKTYFVRQYVIVVIANFTLFQLGANIGILSPMAVKFQDPNQKILSTPLTNSQVSWFMSVNSILSMISLFYCGYLTDKIGRKNTLLIATIPRIGTCILFLLSREYWMLILGRCFCGLSDSFSISITATYVSEIASKEIRGGLGTIAQILSSIGSMMFLVMAPFLSFTTTNIILTVTTVVTSVPLLFLPETPYYLYTKGKKEEAIKTLTFLRGSLETACEEINEYTTSNQVVDKKQLLKDKVVLKTIGKVLFLAIGSQMIGYNAVIFYVQIIFESTQTSIRSEVTTAIIGCVQLIACFCTVYLTDRFGRKPVLVITLVWMAVGMIGLGTFFILFEEKQITGFLNYLPVISLIVVIYSFNAGMGSLVWAVIAELFDGPSRAFGVSFGVLTATIFTFLTTKFFSQAIDLIGPAVTYWIFAAFCIVTGVFIGVFIPETKGKTFSQIQKDMGRDMKVDVKEIAK